MKRRTFIKKSGSSVLSLAGMPYLLPSGRLFAPTGSRIADHVVFVLFAGGIRNQESVEQQYLQGQGMTTSGNVLNNMLEGTAPTNNIIYDQWDPILSQPLSRQATLFRELQYSQGPTGHYNGHTVAMTGNYTSTGLNLNINPEFPTVFEYYRKHNDPVKSAMNAWWLSEGLGPYPSLNYSRHFAYGPQYGANYLRPLSIFSNAGFAQLGNAVNYQPDDVDRIQMVKSILDNNFDRNAQDLPGIRNTQTDRERIKTFMLNKMQAAATGTMQVATPGNNYSLLTGDLINISMAWQVLDEFAPELMVINTFNLDVCHSDFSGYVNFLHKADYGVGWLWDKIQSHPQMANNTIMICMPEHGRNALGNSIRDANGLEAFDHSAAELSNPDPNLDKNARRTFAMIVGPPDKIKQNQALGNPGNPVAEPIDVVPTIAHILGFHDDIPGGLLSGRILQEAFI